MLSEQQFDQAIYLVGELARRDVVNQHRMALRAEWNATTAPTGLEHLTCLQVVQAAEARWSRSQMLTSSWDTLSHSYLREWWRSRLKIANYRVFEIGVGQHEALHRRLFIEEFKAQSYKAIDRNGGLSSDALLQLTAMDDNSVDALACFGVFNEPLLLFPFQATPPRWLTALPQGMWRWMTEDNADWEYNRRLFREIARVVSPGGVVFGTGLQDGGIDAGGWENAELLEQNGFNLTAGFNEHQNDASIHRILRERLRHYTVTSLTEDDVWNIKLCLGTFIYTKGSPVADGSIH